MKYIKTIDYKDNIYVNIYANGYQFYHLATGHNHHRLDGPAILCDYNNYMGYYIDGKIYINFIEYIRDVIKYKKGENNEMS